VGQIVHMEEKFTDANESRSKTVYPMLACELRVRRHVGFYLWNIFFPVFFITMYSCCTFFFRETESTSSRLEVVLQVPITLVALKFSFAEYMPKISSVTTLDTYMLVSFLCVTLVVVQNTWIGSWLEAEHFYQDDTAEPDDLAEVSKLLLYQRISLYVFLSIWGGWNLYFCFQVASEILKAIRWVHSGDLNEEHRQLEGMGLLQYFPVVTCWNGVRREQSTGDLVEDDSDEINRPRTSISGSGSSNGDLQARGRTVSAESPAPLLRRESYKYVKMP